MQISNTASAAQYVQQAKYRQPGDNRQGNARVQVENDSKQLARRESLGLDSQAISLIEQGAPYSADSQSENTGYDEPSQQNRSAVALYQSVDNQAQRDKVQNMLGVDLFA